MLSLWLIAFAAMPACVAELQQDPVAELQQRFPTLAHLALGSDGGFAVGPDGTAVAQRSDEGAAAMALAVNRRGAATLRLIDADGLRIGVAEHGIVGDCAVAGRSLTCPRAGGHVFWSAVDGGYEEWLSLDASVVRADRPVARWTITGAKLRQRGELVEVVDAAGETKLRVSAAEAYAEGGERVDAHLTVRGQDLELSVEADGRAVLIDPSWVAVASMTKARAAATAIKLANGNVLVAGGRNGQGNLSGAEVYNLSGGIWSGVAAMKTARQGHTASLLSNGTVLVAGGLGAQSLSGCEVFNLSGGIWANTSSMAQPRAAHTATVLKDGRVLVTGGKNGSSWLSGAEVYNLSGGIWTSLPAMTKPRANHTATLLTDGRVLIAGGQNGQGYLSGAEVLNLSGGAKWTPVPSMAIARGSHAATLLASGNVLITGGSNGTGSLSGAEVFTLSGGIWARLPAMSSKRSAHTAVAMATGNVLIAGGYNGQTSLSGCEVFNLSGGTWAATSPMISPRYSHNATLLSNGQVLVTGGVGSGGVFLSGAEKY